MSALCLVLPSFLLLLQQQQEIGALSIAVRHVDAALQEHARHAGTSSPQELAARQAYAIRHIAQSTVAQKRVLAAGRLDVVFLVPPQEHAMLTDIDMRVVLVTEKEMLADMDMRVVHAMLADMDMEMEMHTASQLSVVGVVEVVVARVLVADSGWLT